MSHGWWRGKHRRQERARRWTSKHQAALFFPLLLLEGLTPHWVGIHAVWRGEVKTRRLEAALLVAHVGVCLDAVFVVLSPPVALAFIAAHQGLWGV